MDYNRVVKDLNGHSLEALLAALDNQFIVSKVDAAYKPTQLHSFGMYLQNQIQGWLLNGYKVKNLRN